MSNFSARIIKWQRQHGRHGLPWQGADAYHVWLSEIMLQQTQVATAIPYYQRFIARFPDIATLVAASEDAVMAHWSGLGYYARGRNLHRAAQIIAEKHHGEFPREFEQILRLPGIGRSTAAAISVFAFHERRAILEGNVKRVLARYFAIAGFTGEKKIEIQLWQQAEALLPHSLPPTSRGITGDLAALPPSRMASSFIRAGERGGSDDSIVTYTQGMMDLGATVCIRSKPHCGACPVQTDCKAYQSGSVAQFPAPRPKKGLPEKHTTFLLLMHGNDILLEKRPGSGIWGGLWCPPQLDNNRDAAACCARQFGVDMEQAISLPAFKHTFTHFKLLITPLLVQVIHKPKQAQEPGKMWMDREEALRAAIPTPVRNLLRELQAQYILA